MAKHIDTFSWADAPEGTTHRDSLNQCFIQYDFDGVYYDHKTASGWLAYDPEEVAIKYFLPKNLNNRED